MTKKIAALFLVCLAGSVSILYLIIEVHAPLKITMFSGIILFGLLGSIAYSIVK